MTLPHVLGPSPDRASPETDQVTVYTLGTPQQPGNIGFFVVIVGLFCLLFFAFFKDGVSLCNTECPGTHFVDQGGLKLRDLSASAS